MCVGGGGGVWGRGKTNSSLSLEAISGEKVGWGCGAGGKDK